MRTQRFVLHCLPTALRFETLSISATFNVGLQKENFPIRLTNFNILREGCYFEHTNSNLNLEF